MRKYILIFTLFATSSAFANLPFSRGKSCIHLRLHKKIEPYHLSLLTSDGSLVLEEDIHKKGVRLDTSELLPGVYVLSIEGKKGFEIRTIEVK